jgi:serine/threonine-protein kinase
VTTVGDVLGTPAYLAPELGTGDRIFDQRADIYALGCVAFWLLTGRVPFDGKDPLALLMHHAHTPPEPPSALAEEPIPAALDDVVLACLAKEPRGRPRTVDALRERLLAIPLPAPWTERDARSWWDLHEPDVVGAI